MVERELCHECRQYHHLYGDWRTLVESVGLLVGLARHTIKK